MSDSVRPHRRQPTKLPHPWDSLGKNTGVGCHFLPQCMKVKSQSEVAQSLSRVRLLATPWTAAHQAPPSMGFSRQEYWSGVPLPSPLDGRWWSNYPVLILSPNLIRNPHLARTWGEEKVRCFIPSSNILLSSSPQSYQGVRRFHPAGSQDPAP